MAEPQAFGPLSSACQLLHQEAVEKAEARLDLGTLIRVVGVPSGNLTYHTTTPTLLLPLGRYNQLLL